MSLKRSLLLGDLDLTCYPFGVEFGGDLGSPENVYDTLVSLLSDGDLSTSDRVSNRTLTFSVLIEGEALTDLAASEAALIAECDKPRNTLTIDPGDGVALPAVFDIFRVQARLQYDDTLEQATYRRYELTIPARPYPRGADLVVTPAAGTATETVLDSCSATTNWTTTGGATPTLDSGTLVSATAAPARLDRAGLDLTGVTYLAVTWQTSSPAVSFEVTTGFFGGMPIVSTSTSGAWTTSFVKVPAGTAVVTLSLFASFQPGFFGTTTTGTLTVDKVSAWTSLPSIGTARQKALSLIPGGAVPTTGSIQVAHDTDALGKVVVHTHPSGTGYLPPLRPWLVSSPTVTTDSSLVSGARNLVDNGTTVTTYRIPVSALPKGRAEVWAWVRSVTGSGDYSLDWAIASYMGSASLTYSLAVADLGTLTLNQWALVPIGVAVMPPIDIGPAGFVEVHLGEPGGPTNNLEVDEAYLFATDDGSLTVVDCGTGTAESGGPSNRLWIDAPSPERPNGAIFRGFAEDRSDAFHAGPYVKAPGLHDFAPAGMNVFVATPGALDADTSLEHYRRYHTHVAEF